MELIPEERYFYKGWEIVFFSEKPTSEGHSSGLAQVRKMGELRCSLLSTGNFENRIALFENLKTRGIGWIDEQLARGRVAADREETNS
jgi:hypothetical protein